MQEHGDWTNQTLGNGGLNDSTKVTRYLDVKTKVSRLWCPIFLHFCHRFSKMVCWKVGHFNWLSNHTWRWLIITRIDYETPSFHFSKLSPFRTKPWFNLQKVNFLSTKFRCFSSHHFWITRGPNSTVTTGPGGRHVTQPAALGGPGRERALASWRSTEDLVKNGLIHGLILGYRIL